MFVIAAQFQSFEGSRKDSPADERYEVWLDVMDEFGVFEYRILNIDQRGLKFSLRDFFIGHWSSVIGHSFFTLT